MLTIVLLCLAVLCLLVAMPNMAALSSVNPTLADWAKELDPDGDTADIVRLLMQTNLILEDQVYVKGNAPTGHNVTVETGLPDVYFRSINAGIPSSKATSAQVFETCAILEARSQIDVDLVKLNGNDGKYRLNQARRFIEAMNQKMARTLFYGNHAVDSKEFTGFAARYSSLSAGNAQNILDASPGGVGTDNTSIWLIGWGEDTVFSPFPDGSMAGLFREELGQNTIQNVNGVMGESMEAMCERFQWKPGLAVADWHYAVRIANIDVSDLVAQTGTQELTDSTNIIRMMIRALDRIPNLGLCRPAFYCNRTVRSALAIHAMDKSSSVLDIEKGVNQFKVNFLGVPVRLCDQLLSTEDHVN